MRVKRTVWYILLFLDDKGVLPWLDRSAGTEPVPSFSANTTTWSFFLFPFASEENLFNELPIVLKDHDT